MHRTHPADTTSYVDTAIALTGEAWKGIANIRCPFCGGDYSHVREVFTRFGTDEGGHAYPGTIAKTVDTLGQDSNCPERPENPSWGTPCGPEAVRQTSGHERQSARTWSKSSPVVPPFQSRLQTSRCPKAR